jgi:tRNA-splicing ligase RtcB
MPAWCGFRDAARAEHMAKEAREVELPPQDPKYRNSPLSVFGDHDEATITQIKNCMGVGNAVAGVICADGHLGYAQPVGGVIAYEKQISISGVGFDIGCGNMAVRLDTRFTGIESRVPELLGDVRKTISFGVGRTNAERAEHDYSTMPKPGGRPAWLTTGRRRLHNWAQSDRETITLI